MPATTIIPQLEPLAGSGLAVSLAYLALERFRYRDSIERYAREKKIQFRNEDDSDTIEVVKDLQWLCRQDCNGHTPRGGWANFYHLSFRSKADEWLIAFLAVMSGITLVFGVAMNVGLWPWVRWFESPWIVSLLFYFCLASLLIPAGAVLCGRKCVSWCWDFADLCEREITKIHRQSARAAAAPPPPQNMDQQRLMRLQLATRAAQLRPDPKK